MSGAEISGPGLCALMDQRDETLGKRLASQIAASVAAIRAIPAPFDRAILGSDDAPSRRAIAQAISALQLQTQSLTPPASSLQLTASTRELER